MQSKIIGEQYETFWCKHTWEANTVVVFVERSAYDDFQQIWATEAFSKLSKTSKIELFEKILNGFSAIHCSCKKLQKYAWLGSACAVDIQWNFAIADIPNSGHAMNSWQNIYSQMWQSFLNYFPIAGTSQQRTIF